MRAAEVRCPSRLAVMCCIFAAAIHSAAGEVRLALLATDSRCSMPVELLTAQFSRPEYGLALLERAEVARIAREQNLMAGNSAGFARLGNLLGAHGVLVLDVFEQKQTTNITVKLVAVRSGVVVGFQSYPWPLEELSEWPTLVGRQFKALFPKVDVLAGDAVPISVLNLRSPISTSEATVLTTPAEGAVKKQA